MIKEGQYSVQAVTMRKQAGEMGRLGRRFLMAAGLTAGAAFYMYDAPESAGQARQTDNRPSFFLAAAGGVTGVTGMMALLASWRSLHRARRHEKDFRQERRSERQELQKMADNIRPPMKTRIRINDTGSPLGITGDNLVMEKVTLQPEQERQDEQPAVYSKIINLEEARRGREARKPGRL